MQFSLVADLVSLVVDHSFGLIRALRRRAGCIVSLLLHSALLASSLAQATGSGERLDRLLFEHVEGSEDLASVATVALAQDRQGFLWVGTRNGVNRFDGVEFRQYLADSGETNGPQDSWVEEMRVDLHGHLWIGLSRGISRYDETHDAFADYMPGGDDVAIKAIAEDSEGRLYIVSLKGIVFRYNQSVDLFEALSEPMPWPVRSMLIDSRDRMWLGGDGGLALLDEAYRETVEHVPLPPGAGSKARASVEAIVESPEGRVIYGVNGYGVWTYETGGGGRPEPFLMNDLARGIIGTLMVDDEGNLFIGSSSGLTLARAENGAIRHYGSGERGPGSLQPGTVYSLLFDHEGNLWAGTSRGGLSAAYNRKAFGALRPSALDAHSLSREKATSIFQDSQNQLWIGYHNEGIDLLSADERRKQHYPAQPDRPERLGAGSVFEIVEASNGEMWIGTSWSGLQRLDPATGEVERFLPDPGDPASISGSDVRRIVEDRNGNFWLAVHGSGVDYFDRSSGKFSRLDAVSSPWVEDLLLDENGEVWIASSEGLDHFRADGTLVRSFVDDRAEHGLSDRHVNCLLIDPAGYLWAGTRDGLDRIDRKTGRIDRYHLKAGLPSADIRSLAQDESGALWAATAGGLAVFDQATESFLYYDKSDGLVSSDFVVRSAELLRDGRLMFGTERGIVRFWPEQIEPNEAVPPVVITGVKLFGERLEVDPSEDGILRRSPMVAQRLLLPPGQGSFGFEFAALSFVDPSSNRYAYMLEGFDEQWKDNGSRRDCSYTNIGPGTYVFRVKASNNDGVWNQQGQELTVIVRPHYWQTWWFNVLLFLTVMSVALAFYLIRVRGLARQKAALEVAVVERTHLLQEALDELESQKGFIEEQNLELRDHRENLEELIEQRTAELEEARIKAEASERLKSSFLENVSHEIRTPMNAILGFLNLLKHKEVSESEKEEYNRIIERNGEALLALIDDILDLASMESDALVLKREQVDLSKLFKDLHTYFRKVAASNLANVAIELDVEQDSAQDFVWSDVGRLQQIVNNLLDNALKFTERGSVRFGYRLRSDDNKKWWLEIFVSDTGIGIAKDSLRSIFQRFHKLQSDRQKIRRGTGLGLAIVKRLVDLMGGTISVESDTGAGTRFQIFIPVERVANGPEE